MNCSGFLFLAGWLCLAAASLGAADALPAAYPLWDGKETIAQYAGRANLPETKTFDLGNGVALELALIPAGKFIMGTPEPEPPWIGGTTLGIACLVVLVMVRQILIRAVRQHRRPQFSLLWLIVVVLILGVAEHGGFRYWRAVQAKLTFYPGEWPAHAVTLTKAFYLGKFEVTQEQYMQVMGTNPSGYKGANGREARPTLEHFTNSCGLVAWPSRPWTRARCPCHECATIHPIVNCSSRMSQNYSRKSTGNPRNCLYKKGIIL